MELMLLLETPWALHGRMEQYHLIAHRRGKFQGTIGRSHHMSVPVGLHSLENGQDIILFPTNIGQKHMLADQLSFTFLDSQINGAAFMLQRTLGVVS